jgi:tRNA(Ile)-lysidine synthase
MLDCRRRDIMSFLAARGLPARLDRTNLVTDNPRNRLRQAVLPRLEAYYAPGLTDSILVGIAAFRRAHHDLVAQAAEAIEEGGVASTDRYVRFEAAWLASMPDGLAKEVAHQVMAQWVPNSADLTAEHHRRVVDLCRAGVHGAAVALPGGLVIRREYDGCVIQPANPDGIPEDEVGGTPIALATGVTPLPRFGGSLAVQVGDAGPRTLADFLARHSSWSAIFDADRLQGRLAVRAWQTGDRMQLLGAQGRRKLQDVFTDLKVPRAERRKVPLLTLDGHPIWIIGNRVAEDARVCPTTRRVAEMKFRRDNVADPSRHT